MNANKNGFVSLLVLSIIGILGIIIFVITKCTEVIEPFPIQVETTTGTTISTLFETETTSSNTLISTTYSITTIKPRTTTTTEIITSAEGTNNASTIYSTFLTTTKKIEDIIVITNYDIIVITDKITTQTTMTTNQTTTLCQTTTSNIINNSNRTFIRTFPKGTYYCYEKPGVLGGSGRTLIDCSIGDDIVKGSVACRYIYEVFGYTKNDRTKIYLEIPEYPEMTGYYYLDDCNSSVDIIDFFFYYDINCPFRSPKGVTLNISCYVD